MGFPFFSMFQTSPFDGLQKHAETVKECAWAFQQAIECYTSDKCNTIEEYRKEVNKLESEADTIKRRIRNKMPRGARIPMSRFQLFMYLKEQDNVLDSVEEALDWLSCRTEPGIPIELKKDFLLLVDAVVDPIEDLSRMVGEAKKYFDNYSDKQREIVKEIINNLRQREHEADRMEDKMKQKIFSIGADPVTIFHVVKLIEIIGSIADHAENAGDMMRAMIAKKRGFWGDKR